MSVRAPENRPAPSFSICWHFTDQTVSWTLIQWHFGDEAGDTLDCFQQKYNLKITVILTNGHLKDYRIKQVSETSFHSSRFSFPVSLVGFSQLSSSMFPSTFPTRLLLMSLCIQPLYLTHFFSLLKPLLSNKPLYLYLYPHLPPQLSSLP